MTEVFVIRNQLGHFWGKSKAWVDGSDARAVLRVKHRDEASNTLFELSSKDFELRGEIIPAETNAKGDPMVTVSDIPLPEVPGEETDETTPDGEVEVETLPSSESAPQEGATAEDAPPPQ